MANKNLTAAKKAANDEFYTQLDDIIAEIAQHKDYVRQFQGKTVFCNCDDPEWSAFVEFFRKFFKKLGLKKMICTHYEPDGSSSYKLEWSGEKINGDTVNMIKTPLQGNGDFRSPECIELLKEADIVVTNPPFSIAREYFIPLLYEYGKKFVVIGDLNWVTYKDIFPLFKSNQMFFGYTAVKAFRVPDGAVGKDIYEKDGVRYQKFGNKVWYTNLDLDKSHEPLILTKNYTGNEDKYPKYDNYDAIECGKFTSSGKWQGDLSMIPKDYFGVMGVPITYIAVHCPEQFEILDANNYRVGNGKKMSRETAGVAHHITIDGESIYRRILIQRKPILQED